MVERLVDALDGALTLLYGRPACGLSAEIPMVAAWGLGDRVLHDAGLRAPGSCSCVSCSGRRPE